ncbi:MAG: acyltransferase [Fimbriimonadaceae bacterium]|nr:acyltransferase [Fimbriimonadaceae bacterium]
MNTEQEQTQQSWWLSLFTLRRIISQGSYVPAVDGVRAIAIICVLLDHACSRVLRRVTDIYPFAMDGAIYNWFNFGGTGVLLFFTLSGYILHAGIRRAIERDGKLKGSFLKKYFLRRLTRLEPPYLILLTVIFVFLSVTGYSSGFGANSATQVTSLINSYWASFFYVHQAVFNQAPMINPPLWSLEIEVQFYIIAPAISLVLYALFARWTKKAIGIAILLAAVWVGFFYSMTAFPIINQVFLIIRFLPVFFVGIIFGEISSRNLLQMRPQTADFLAWTGLLTILAIQLFDVHTWYLELIFILPAHYFILNGAIHGGGFKRLLSVNGIATFGGMCYSIYLIHLPAMEFIASPVGRLLRGAPFELYLPVQIVLMICLAMVPSLIYYVLIERPCMNPSWPQDLYNFAFRKRIVKST